MTINKFKVFTWDRIAVYLGICFAFPLACFAQAIRYNYFQRHSGLPVGAWAAMIGALLGFSLGVFRLFWDRYVFKKTIWGYTSDGIGIIKPTYTINNEPSFDDITKQIEAASAYDLNFWEKFYNNYGVQMEDVLNGAFIGFTGQKIELAAPVPLSSMVTNTKFSKFAVGITDWNDCLIMWQPNENFTANVIPRIKHELSHVMLNAANASPQDGNAQHAIMAKEGFPY